MTRFDSLCDSITQKVIESLEKGKIPWEKQWENIADNNGIAFPHNGFTGEFYSGFNVLALLISQYQHGYKSATWLTYKQAQDLDVYVRKGEKATQGVYWAEKIEETKDENGKVKKEKHLIPCVFSVFNEDKIEGLDREITIIDDTNEFKKIERAEKILKNSGAVIHELPQNRAFYSPASDSITLPLRSQFKSAEGFYDTAFHELGHWTGHKSRLNREMIGRFGSPDYAREELRAELASFFLSASLGIPHDSENHKAYIQSWIKALKDDPREIYRAAQDAKRINEFIMKFDN